MDVLGQYLDEHADRRPGTVDAPAERLLKFDAWMRKELEARLDWTWAGAAKERRIEQCRVYLERMVIALWKRGWMLDGKRLAARITDLLTTVGAYQRRGEVKDFWAYFSAAVDRYVGINSEEIQAEAQRAGAHVGQALAAILAGASRNAEPTLPELVAQRASEVQVARDASMRARLARARARKAACKADAEQGQLL